MNVSGRYGLHDDGDWSQLLVPTEGWVLLGDTGRPFALSMLHQLHCLRGLRSAIIVAAREDLSAQTVSHINHCLDYLRQSILCCGDTTLEGAQSHVEDGKQVWGASAYGVTHTCRDWTHVFDYMQEHVDQWSKMYNQ